MNSTVLNNMRILRKYQVGTSLVEVMVSMAVIAFGILGIVYLQGELASQSSENKARAEAAAYAEARIEEIRNYSDENIIA